jgi:hypothetical protein
MYQDVVQCTEPSSRRTSIVVPQRSMFDLSQVGGLSGHKIGRGKVVSVHSPKSRYHTEYSAYPPAQMDAFVGCL